MPPYGPYRLRTALESAGLVRAGLTRAGELDGFESYLGPEAAAMLPASGWQAVFAGSVGRSARCGRWPGHPAWPPLRSHDRRGQRRHLEPGGRTDFLRYERVDVTD